MFPYPIHCTCFNTQPPEGGWLLLFRSFWLYKDCFNTQPPEGGWVLRSIGGVTEEPFQHTAARRRLATFCELLTAIRWFQHTAARRRLVTVNQSRMLGQQVSTHSRPKAAGLLLSQQAPLSIVSTHSRPKAAGPAETPKMAGSDVSTHSRPKAAGLHGLGSGCIRRCFNTQPPEGGWAHGTLEHIHSFRFQHTAARRRLAYGQAFDIAVDLFQHTAARRRLA